MIQLTIFKILMPENPMADNSGFPRCGPGPAWLKKLQHIRRV